MKRQPSLATRAFFFAFVPMWLTLAASFFAINKAVESRIKGRLRLSLQRTERVLASRDAEYRRHTLNVLSAVAENPSLKAVIGLLRESSDPKSQGQVYGILADQLGGMNKSLDYDLLLLENPQGKLVVGLAGVGGARLRLDLEPVEFFEPSLLRVQGVLYETVPVPINLGYENLGTLILGEKFNLASWSELGYAALLRDGKVILTTYPGDRTEEVERQIQQRCGGGVEDCEITVGGESYLTLAVRRESFGGQVRLLQIGE